MAITPLNSTVSPSGSSTLNRPGVVEGDLLIMLAAQSPTASLYPTPSGWTPLLSSGGSSGGRLQSFWKLAGASEPSSYSKGIVAAKVTINAYRGTDPAGPIGNAQGTEAASTTATIVAAGLTIQSNGSRLFAGFYFPQSRLVTSPPDGMTLRTDGTGSSPSIATYDEAHDAGATGTRSLTWSSTVSARTQAAHLVELIPGNAAPNAPTDLSFDGTTISRLVANDCTYTFSDPDSGDTQSANQYRYRLTGALEWTETAVNETVQHRISVAADALPDGDYELQIRNADSQGEWSGYSASAFFTVATPPGAPTIVAPANGATVPQQDLFEWSTLSQTAWELRRLDDDAGSPDEGAVLEVIGAEASATRSYLVVADSGRNGLWEHRQIWIRRNGLWSPISTVRVLVSFTPPASPTVALTDALRDGLVAGVTIAVTHPTPVGDQPTVESHDIYRQQSRNGTDWTDEAGTVGAATRIATGATAATVDDLTAPGHPIQVRYWVRANGDNGSTADSAPQETIT